MLQSGIPTVELKAADYPHGVDKVVSIF